MHVSHMTIAALFNVRPITLPRNWAPRARRARNPRYHCAAMANRNAEGAIHSARSGDAVAVNCRNKPRCCKQLTLRERGLIMHYA